jgi:hypothetical protein
MNTPVSPDSERDMLRRTLKAKLNASKINRMPKQARTSELDKLQARIQKEMGADFDLSKMVQVMDQRVAREQATSTSE